MSAVPPPGPDAQGRRPLRGDRRLVLGLIGLAALLGAAYFWLQAKSIGGAPSPLRYALLAGNVLVLVAVVFYLLRYVIRLLDERRSGLLGSRFRFKLIATFVGLCLVPAMLLYVAAILILLNAVDKALAPDVGQIVLHAQAVAAQFYDDAEADLRNDLRDVAAQAAPLVQGGEPFAFTLRPVLEASRIAAVRIQTGTGVTYVSVPALAGRRSPLDRSDLSEQQLERDLSRLAETGHFARLHQVGSKVYLLAGQPLEAQDGARLGTIIVARRIPADLQARVQSLMTLAEEHARIAAEKPWVKAEHALTFLWLLLVVILGAIWVGLLVARNITTPIQRLAEATIELRRGNLGHVVDWSGRDELAMLVSGFNEMSRALQAQQREIERRARELEHANTQLASANDEVERRRRHMEMLLETMTAGVIAVDASGLVVVANRAAHQILGLRALGAGQPVERVLAGDALADLRHEVAQALQRRVVRRERASVLALERGEVHLQVVITSQPDATGGRGLLLLFEDVTELVRAQKLATWRQAARRIAHEIKNPLTPIQLSAQRMLKKWRERSGDFGPVLEGGVETIIAEVSGLKQLVDEFTDFARMPEVRPVAGDLGAMLESVRALYAGHERLEMRLDLEPGMPQVPFDPELLRRCIVNLVDNAVEATGGDGIVTLEARVDSERGLAVVAVSDDGPGIPDDVRDDLFLPYFTTRERGTGLGLAIVHRIVVDHGGRVRADAMRARGARFVIELPLEPRRAVAAAERNAAGEPEARRVAP